MNEQNLEWNSLALLLTLIVMFRHAHIENDIYVLTVLYLFIINAIISLCLVTCVTISKQVKMMMRNDENDEMRIHLMNNTTLQLFSPSQNSAKLRKEAN